MRLPRAPPARAPPAPSPAASPASSPAPSPAAASPTASPAPSPAPSACDLDSDVDEGTLRRELLNDKWRQLFDKFDPEGFGEIPREEFLRALAQPAFRAAVDAGRREVLAERARRVRAVSFQDFVNVMSGKRSRSFKCAVHHRDGEVSSACDFHLLRREAPRARRMARLLADHFLTDERDRKYYADHYSCCPPPLFLIGVTLLELGFFAYYALSTGQLGAAGPVPVDSAFVYRPDRRIEVWRFVLYMVLHAGWLHLLFNLSVQLLVGLPLEMVHGSLRIAAVYMAGVLAGSLGTSVLDGDVYLVGASGGVYALLAAHLANVLLNYSSMALGALRLAAIFVVASCDVGFAVYARYAAEASHAGDLPGASVAGAAGAEAEAAAAAAHAPVSYVAHLAGALAGLTIGLLVLKNFEQRLHEQLLWWVALGVYAACTLFAVLFNVFNPVDA